MGQQVKVYRDIQFLGNAQHNDNVEGNLSTNRMSWVDWFAIDSTGDYTETVGGTNDVIAPIVGGVTGISLLSGDTDNEVCFIGTDLIFDISNEPEIATKVRLTDVSQTSFFFGFSDANTETTPASTIDYADGTLAAAAADAAGFVSDADKESSLYYAASIATSGSVSAATTGVTPTDTTYNVLRIRLNSSGDAFFYVDGVLTNFKAAAVTDVPLCAIFNAGTRDGGAGDLVYVKYLKAWQDV